MRYTTFLVAAFAAMVTATANVDNLSSNDLTDAYDLISRFDNENGNLLPARDVDVANKGGGGGKGGGKGKGKGKGGKGGGATSKCGPCQDCLSNCQGLEGEFADSGCTLGCATSKTCKGC